MNEYEVNTMAVVFDAAQELQQWLHKEKLLDVAKASVIVEPRGNGDACDTAFIVRVNDIVIWNSRDVDETEDEPFAWPTPESFRTQFLRAVLTQQANKPANAAKEDK